VLYLVKEKATKLMEKVKGRTDPQEMPAAQFFLKRVGCDTAHKMGL